MTNKPLVSVNILTYNAQDLIEPCLDSVLEQTYSNIKVLIIDNASRDKTLEKAQSTKRKAQNIPFRIIENGENSGFAAGHNVGIKKSKGEYILCLNQDVVLDKDFIKNAVEAMEVDKQIGAVQGKLFKIKDIRYPSNEIIDTTGLIIFKNRRIINRGQGEKDKNQHKRGEIFGTDGASPLYRRSALEDIKLPIFKGSAPCSDCFEYFDEDFFMYKEDVDLSWRLRLYGWKTVYEPMAIGYHLRGAGDKATKNYLVIIKERRKISEFAKYHSFKNQRLMQIKNELLALFFYHFCCILIKEAGAWFYALFLEKYAWKTIGSLFKQIPNAWRKRKIIMSRKKTSIKEMKKWFV